MVPRSGVGYPMRPCGTGLIVCFLFNGTTLLDLILIYIHQISFLRNEIIDQQAIVIIIRAPYVTFLSSRVSHVNHLQGS